MNENLSSNQIWVDDTQNLICGTRKSLENLRDQISVLLSEAEPILEFAEHDFEGEFLHRLQVFEDYQEYLAEDEQAQSTTRGERFLIVCVCSIPAFALVGFIHTCQCLYCTLIVGP